MTRIHTSTAATRRHLHHACRAAAAGNPDLMLYHTRAACYSMPSQSPLRRRMLNLHRRLRGTRYRDWYSRLVRSGYRPVYHPQPNQLPPERRRFNDLSRLQPLARPDAAPGRPEPDGR